MFKVTKEEWIAALRSGKYLQATGELNVAGQAAFCCLGVACELDGMDWSLRETHEGSIWTEPHVADDGSEYLSASFITHLGLTQGQCQYLARMNDNRESFEQIAAVIESGSIPELNGISVEFIP